MKEATDEATSKADLPVKEPMPTQGGFPEDLEPGVEAPRPDTPTESPATARSARVAGATLRHPSRPRRDARLPPDKSDMLKLMPTLKIKMFIR